MKSNEVQSEMQKNKMLEKNWRDFLRMDLFLHLHYETFKSINYRTRFSIRMKEWDETDASINNDVQWRLLRGQVSFVSKWM